LHSLTRNHRGIAVPKQYCSLQGGASLLADTLGRANAVAPRERLCAVVADQHRQWWANGMLDGVPDSNIFVQPHNRGTAHGILFPLVKIAARDPQATVILLPADHHFKDEETIAATLRRAAVLATANSEAVHLLGVQPEAPDTELGYILPSFSARQRSRRIVRFIEKPRPGQARRLVELGALWNIFIIAASIRTLLTLYSPTFDATIAAMRDADGRDLEELYRTLPHIDFSRDILEGNEAKLRVLTVPRCGWTDLGTPDRIGLLARRFEEEQTISELPEGSLMGQYLQGQGGFEQPHSFGHPPALSFGPNLWGNQSKLL
jgi:mannose-1-phosphate guanylyltransferase